MTLPKDPQKREEYLQKQRELAKARMANPEWKAFYLQKQNEGMKNPETVAKMQKVQQWRRDNPENAEKYEADKEARRQALRKPEVRKKNSETVKAHMAKPGVKEAISVRTKEAMQRPEVKAKVSEIRKQIWQDPIAREHFIQGQARRWERDEEREKQRRGSLPSRLKNATRHGFTDIETIVKSLLDALEIEHEAQKHIGHWIVDFYIPSHNLVIECDGDYWHSSEKAKATDKRKDAYLDERGYKVVRLLGSQIHAKEFNALLEALGMEG